MNDFTRPDRGPLVEYEVVWKSGHVDRLKAHQVTHCGGSLFAFGTRAADEPERVVFHGEFDGRWQLVLSALVDDITTIRNLSQCEDTP